MRLPFLMEPTLGHAEYWGFDRAGQHAIIESVMAARPNAPAVVVLAPGDNVGIAGRPLAPGESLQIADMLLVAVTAVPLGHKIALQEIAAGAKVFRCGVPIGLSTRLIKAGEHVHTQNLKSDYLPTFTLDAPPELPERAR